MEYRHELKYVIDSTQLVLLEHRIKNLIKPDSHVGESGVYRIRSLYFDDCYDSCFIENEIGTDPREKYRIRIYNESSDRIRLELKQKNHGMTKKLSCPLTLEQCKLLMAGKVLPFKKDYPPVLQKLLLQMQTRRMEPKVIVEYERRPFVDALGNVRITFDRNISSSTDISKFLDKRISKRPIMPVGEELLEVKYDEFLPDYIKQNLQLGKLKQTAFSKYYLCKKYKI